MKESKTEKDWEYSQNPLTHKDDCKYCEKRKDDCKDCITNCKWTEP